MSPHQALELSSVPEAQPRGQAMEGMALGAQGRGHRAPPAQLPAAAVASLPCLATKDGPAGHNLLLRIPAVLSRLPWHGRAEPGCTKPSRAEPSHPPNSPKSTATLSHAPSPAGAWGSECQG